jgi:hypothetical protein
MVVGLFDSLVSAQHAVASLMEAGYSRAGISILIRKGNGTTGGDSRSESADDGDEGWTPDSVVCDDETIGVVAGGPLAKALHSTPDADCESSMTRVLCAAGMAPAAASYFARAVRAGNILVSVNCEDSLVRDARDILDDHAATDAPRRAPEFDSSARSERRAGSGT